MIRFHNFLWVVLWHGKLELVIGSLVVGSSAENSYCLSEQIL
jgi:hypothetical protein